MMKKAEFLPLPDELVMNKIYMIRNQKVMLDRDLAELYGVQTKVLKQSVKRNLHRFPDDFMFELTETEFINWRSQFVTSNSDKMGLRYKPFCFTEQGVAMLSSVLNSEKAITVNIQIIRIFTKIRQVLMDNTEIRLIIEELKKKTDNNTKNIEVVFQYLDELLDKKENPKERNKIGYKIDGK
jgi:phage regulator Rha-like protein